MNETIETNMNAVVRSRRLAALETLSDSVLESLIPEAASDRDESFGRALITAAAVQALLSARVGRWN